MIGNPYTQGAELMSRWELMRGSGEDRLTMPAHRYANPAEAAAAVHHVAHPLASVLLAEAKVTGHGVAVTDLTPNPQAWYENSVGMLTATITVTGHSFGLDLPTSSIIVDDIIRWVADFADDRHWHLDPIILIEGQAPKNL